ncbi:MAG TPA: c-type cytochrome domain-containing protein [Thermoanaerobaculaceae bacterium]|nr:c-type cytochrome domain-containing protein [Thermoanaerobaculaceae bacterium]
MSRTETISLVAALAVVTALAVRADAPLSYVKDVEPIFAKHCAECHGGDNPKKGLDLSVGKGYANLLQHKSQEEPLMQLVKAGEPAASYLWLKVSHTATEGRGMPRTIFGAKKLPQEQLDLVRNWIIQGANP